MSQDEENKEQNDQDFDNEQEKSGASATTRPRVLFFENDQNGMTDEFGNIHWISRELSRGGQGVVFRTKDEDLAIKQPLGADGTPDRQVNAHRIFQRVRTLPFPQELPISLPLSILRDDPGYVMKMLNGMNPFSVFALDGERRSEIEAKDLPDWLSGVPDKKAAQDLAYYAETGATRTRLYSLYKCASILARIHNAGMVYGDISGNNVFSNVLAFGKPQDNETEGERRSLWNVEIHIPCECWLIDADNIRFELLHGGKTVYTPHLGAPEIVQGKDAARPRSDCWAFAVMAFQMLALCHPFIGRMVLEPEEDAGWDAEPAENDVPVDPDEQAYAGFLPFIDDEDDDGNTFSGGLKRKFVLTPGLRRLFQETFGAGRIHPHRRPSMVFWARELARAFDQSIVCPACRMSYFYDPKAESCPVCGTPRPPFVMAKTKRWQKCLFGQDKVFETYLPHRMFHPFSLKDSDSPLYEAAVDLNGKGTPQPVLGTAPFPPDLEFESIPPGKTDPSNKG